MIRAQMSEIVKNSRVALRRFLDNVAHGSGVPLLLVRLSKLSESWIENAPVDCQLGIKALWEVELEPDGRPWWVRLFQDNENEIFPAGRTFDAPFLTLLRDDPPFFWWELLTYAKLAAKAQRDGKPDKVVFHAFPGMFEDVLLFGLTYLPELDAHLVLGPVPMRDRIGAGKPDPIGLYCNYIELLGYLESDGHPRHPALAPRSPSAERLTRMFYLGGTFSRRGFRDSAIHAANAVRLAAGVHTELPESELNEGSLQIFAADAVSTGVLFLERARTTTRKLSANNMAAVERMLGPLTPVTIDFNYTDAVSLQLLWRIDPPTQAIVGELTREAAQRDLSEKTTAVSRAGQPDQVLGRFLDELVERIGDRTTQDMLEQLTIGKNWLHDRFAQLSGMTESALADAAELQENSDRICRWLLRLFDADFVAIYQLMPVADGKSKAALRQFGRATRVNPTAQRWSEANRVSMAALESNLADRYKSICYRALWSLKSEQVRNWNGDQGCSGLWILSKPAEASQTRAGIAVPIKVFGRVWGVIELIGFTPNQFDRVDPIWLEEFGTLIGDQFYHTSMLAEIYAINHEILWNRSRSDDDERQLVDPARAKKANNRRHTYLMDLICERMARIFMADAAALWLEDERWPGQFELQGAFGIIEEPHRKSLPSERPKDWAAPRFDRSDESSLSVRAINTITQQIEQAKAATRRTVADASAITRTPRRQVFQETLEKAPADEPATPRFEYHKRQWESFVRHVAIIPLLVRTREDEEQTAIGTIALLTKDHRVACSAPPECEHGGMLGFSNAWVPLMDFAGSQVAMLVRTLRLETHRQNQIELMFSHEVMSKANRIADQFSYVNRNTLQPLFHLSDDRLRVAGFNPDLVRRSSMAAERVNIVADMLTSNLQTMRANGFALPEHIDFRTKKAVPDKPEKIFTLLRDAFNSRHRLVRERRLPNPMFLGNALDFSLRFESFARDDITKILENLADNALKYGAPERSVRISANLVAGTLEIEISNMADPFTVEDNMKLFMVGYRGSAARSSRQSGTGNGLYIARTLAQQIGIDLSHDEVPLPDRDRPPDAANRVLHNFTILISDREVVRDAR